MPLRTPKRREIISRVGHTLIPLQATELDPKYSKAHSRLATAYRVNFLAKWLIYFNPACLKALGNFTLCIQHYEKVRSPISPCHG
jgi:hypothetical protein